MKPKYCLIYCTCPADPKVADIIIKTLIINKLAACVNVIEQVNSYYIWEEKLTTSSEKLLIIKTKFSLQQQVEDTIKKLHPYNCPEIITVPIINCYKIYSKWIDSITST